MIIGNVAEDLVGLNLVTSPYDLVRALGRNHSSIFLANEDSLFDADRISQFGDRCLSEEAIDLERLQGSAKAIGALEAMMSSKGSFFPGAALRDFGEYYALAMPVIAEGKIVGERIKLNQAPYVKDIRASALKRGYLDERKTREELTEDLHNRAIKSVRSFNISRETVLPVLCNEITSMPQIYDGNPVSLVLHSCANYFDSSEERAEKYQSFARKMTERGLSQKELVIAYVDNSSLDDSVPSAAGFYHFIEGNRT